MLAHCPSCKQSNIIAQDIEELSDSALLVKTSGRIQMRCLDCGWMGYEELLVQVKKKIDYERTRTKK